MTERFKCTNNLNFLSYWTNLNDCRRNQQMAWSTLRCLVIELIPIYWLIFDTTRCRSLLSTHYSDTWKVKNEKKGGWYYLSLVNAWEFFKSLSKPYDITNSQLRWEGLRKKKSKHFFSSYSSTSWHARHCNEAQSDFSFMANIFIVPHSLHLNAGNDGWFEDVISQKKHRHKLTVEATNF